MVFQKLINLGIDSDTEVFLRKKIATTNFIALILFVLCIPFIVFTYILFRPLTLFPSLFLVNCIFILGANAAGLNNLSRFLACVVNISIYTIYECYLLPDNEPPFAPLYADQIIFWLIPWLLFDLNEALSLTMYVVFYIVITLSIPLLNNVFTHEFDVESIRNGAVGQFMFFTAATAITGPLFFFMFTNYNSEKKSITLVKLLEGQKNELGDKEEKLKEYVTEIEAKRVEDGKRSWASEGLAKFSEIMRACDSVNEFATELVRTLVPFVGANQGAMFIINDEKGDDVFLEMAGSYASDLNEHLKKRIDIGEGVVGQCFLEKETNYLTVLPANYIRIASGLGDCSPRVLIVLPIYQNDQVYGVLELASLEELANHKIAFLENLCDAIASALGNVKSSEKIKRLLTESQELTRDMRKREEEMRRKLEDLSMSQKEMSRREDEYQKQIQELIGLSSGKNR